MKIAILTQGFDKNASEASNITIRFLVEELSKKHKVVIFCLQQNRRQPLLEKIDNYKVMRKKLEQIPKYLSGRLMVNFSKLIRQEIIQSKQDFDIIHNFSASPILSLRALHAKRNSKGAKLIQTIRALTEQRYSYFATPLLNLFDAVTVPTQFLKKTLVKTGLQSAKIRIVPSYIDTDQFKPRDKNKLKKKYGYHKKKILLYYGHFSEKKGISYLIKAIDLLKEKQKLKFLTLLVTGSEDYYVGPYEKMIEEMKLRKYIKIIKTKKRIENFVALADAVILPYPNLLSTEAQPSCVLETMASKTPLITTDLKELKELINEKEVFFAKPKDVESLARKITETMNKKPNRKMLDRGYQKAKKFDKKRIIKEYVKIYENLVKK